MRLRTTIRRGLVVVAVGAATTAPGLFIEPAHADNQNCGLIPVTNCQYDKEEHHHGGDSSGQQQQQQGSGGGGGGGSSSSSSSGSSGSS